MKTMVSFKEAYQSIAESNIPQMGEEKVIFSNALDRVCLLYTSDAADDSIRV